MIPSAQCLIVEDVNGCSVFFVPLAEPALIVVLG